LELIFLKPRLLCEVQIFPNTFVPITKLSLEGCYLHYFVVLEQIVALIIYIVPDHVFALLFPTRFEILAPSWAIFNGPTHLICFLTLERSMVLDWT
jgi:hypothetical protein